MRTKYLGKGRVTVTLSGKDILDLKLNRRTFNWFVERARLEQKTRTTSKAGKEKRFSKRWARLAAKRAMAKVSDQPDKRVCLIRGVRKLSAREIRELNLSTAMIRKSSKAVMATQRPR